MALWRAWSLLRLVCKRLALAAISLEEWQALIASQASTLAALLSRMQTTAALMRQREPPAAQLQALTAEAERMLTAQARGHVRLERELEELRVLVMDSARGPQRWLHGCGR